MFPLQQGDEPCFQISFDPHSQINIQEDLILAHASVYGTTRDITNKKTSKAGTRNKGKSNNLMATDEAARDGDCSDKKKMHRDIERLRRQEMTTLYSSLRALLPLEYVKGKRSMSDHMNEAANYIRHLQNKIKELGAKRDELKKASSSGLNSHVGSSDACSPSAVVVRPCLGGIEIGFSGGLWGKSFPLSTVLQVLLEEGIPVANCVTTSVNQTLFHTIHTQVNDPTCLNLSGLQQKLTNLMTHWFFVHVEQSILMLELSRTWYSG
ncbi:hypothetical protein K2173_026638 [Erythroxylum novogranatense]|uniref:BHLH domain-containing protein n=1 Tax=Erythroxylum novogranatense TaxID=1862640 RepID=A0AAV8TWT3_9ROSI|nr:hypothetical protein K2173_026638 [Erythroxylum novogranatense]